MAEIALEISPYPPQLPAAQWVTNSPRPIQPAARS